MLFTHVCIYFPSNYDVLGVNTVSSVSINLGIHNLPYTGVSRTSCGQLRSAEYRLNIHCLINTARCCWEIINCRVWWKQEAT